MQKSSSEFHSISEKEVFSLLETSEQGLSGFEVQTRREKYGANCLPEAPLKPAWKRLLEQFHNVLIYILLLSALVSFSLDHYLDASVILGVVVINALVGFVQEGKAESALQAILSMTTTESMVIRDGTTKTLNSVDLVPGDVVILQAGDRVPADIRLFYSKDFHSDESALTGESQPVGKIIDVLSAETPFAERKNMAYMGTLATYGIARGLVTYTGSATQIGEINQMVSAVSLAPTPLQIQLGRFAKQLTMAIVVLAVVSVLFGVYWQGFAFADMFQAAIGMAVAAIPEGLPAIVTITLAIGVQRMAEQKALVRRLPSVEVLGSVDIICSDKTGTLTANAMTVRDVFTANRRFKVSGEGYAPSGAIVDLASDEKVLPGHDATLTTLSTIAMLCNNASINHEKGDWTLSGDPTEGALLAFALKHGLNLKETQSAWQRMDELPFESEKRYMATLHHNAEGQIRLMVKGAPERILHYASAQLSHNQITPLDKQPWLEQIEGFARQGMRVMALAYKDIVNHSLILDHANVEHGLVLVGLVAISDPPRPEAIKSIRACHQAGIKVKMITGDSPLTAGAIGKELGLASQGVLTGQEIEALNDADLAKAIEKTDVFARTSPADKLRLVTALQDNHHVVAMTGDGVNDAPALKKASIGIAMGLKGTDAAKEAADFVLTDDNFSTISRAIAQGRTVYDNIIKSIVFILPTNMAEALVIIAAILLGSLLPITPAQILWVNMVTAITLALALSFEQAEPHIMNRPPRPYNQSLFSPALIFRIFFVGSIGAIIVFSIFNYALANGESIEKARTLAVNALVLFEMFYLFNCRFLLHSIFNRHFLNGIMPTLIAVGLVLIIQMVFTYLPASQTLFGLEALSLSDWALISFSTLPIVFIVELEKWLSRKMKRHA